MNRETDTALHRVNAALRKIERRRDVPQTRHFIFKRAGGDLVLSCWCGKRLSLGFAAMHINVFVGHINIFLENHCDCEQEGQS